MNDQEVALVLNDEGLGNNRLSNIQIQQAKLIIMKIYKAHLSNEVRFQDERLARLDEALRQAKKDFNRAYKKFQNTVKKELGTSTEKKSEREERYNKERPRIMHEHYDPVIQDYEKAAYYGTVSLGALLSDISIALREQGLTMGSIVERSRTKVFVADRLGLGSVHVADYYRYAERFERFHSGIQGRPDVFRHKSSGGEFIQDRNNFFLPRYVIRNLATRDLPHLNKPVNSLSVGMASRNGMVLPDSDFERAVLTHLRAAEQGSSFFVSTTFLTRPIFGATGKGFFDPKNGQVVIDLAELPKERIVDTASRGALKRFMAVEKLDWSVKFGEQQQRYEQMAAARDTVRTGEVLIHGRISREAVVAIRTPDVADGKWVEPRYARTQYGPKRMTYPKPCYA